jgi:hypothetical protein
LHPLHQLKSSWVTKKTTKQNIAQILKYWNILLVLSLASLHWTMRIVISYISSHISFWLKNYFFFLNVMNQFFYLNR